MIKRLCIVLCMQGYRYWAGVTVEANCETALTYYRKVASKGTADIRINYPFYDNY